MKCAICKSDSVPFGQATILQKHDVSYYRCTGCGFVQTEDPHWLKEAYTEAINQSDVGLVNRNVLFSKIANVVLRTFFAHDGVYLDYGGGYGLFVRLMRDQGFDFYWIDQHCKNLFARGYEHDVAAGTVAYDLVTAFEVFEHFTNPLEEVAKLLRYSRTILFSTELIPEHLPRPGEWDYYGLEHGQHVSFYTRDALTAIADRFKLHLYTNGSYMHLLSDKIISARTFKWIARYKAASVLHLFYPSRSLLRRDSEQAVQRLNRQP